MVTQSGNPAPALQDVFAGVGNIAFHGDKKTPVRALRTDSRRVVAGDLFLAVPGTRADGNSFIEEAIVRGAAAIASTEPPQPGLRVPWARVGNMRAALTAAAQNFFGHPERALRAVGVTGTNGKTTVTTLLRHLLAAGGGKWGLLGTVRYDVGGREFAASLTTPEPVLFYDLLAQMRDNACAGFIAEISSHAIAQGRVDGLGFDALAFTNLSRDHIDYHGDMDAYFDVKAGAFLGRSGPPPRHAILNADDPRGRELHGQITAANNTGTNGSAGVAVSDFALGRDAAVRALNIVLDPAGSRFRVVWDGGAADVETALPGRYNVSNVLCALAVARALGRDISELAPLVGHFPGVPGRMERVAANLPFQCLVDYAHTDDALRNALEMLRPITRGRLLVVFGCGGNRDRGKRPKMTAVVQELADFAWATSDNPRKEPQRQIFDDMRTGVSRPNDIRFIEDRRDAIAAAIAAARAGDTLLIAGKGHENTQELADVSIPFDDRDVARALLRETGLANSF